jgi:hypothetical protein
MSEGGESYQMTYTGKQTSAKDTYVRGRVPLPRTYVSLSLADVCYPVYVI